MSKVKICGLTRMEDIEIVNRIKPDYIGFVFAPSRRRIDAATAAAFKKELDPRIEAVGVFVNEDIEAIAKIYRDKVIDLAQLHGDEDEEIIKRLKRLCGCRVIKAVSVRNAVDAGGVGGIGGECDEGNIVGIGSACVVGDFNAFSGALPPLPTEPDYLLFDAFSCGRGGSGNIFDWSVLNNYRGLPFFLAGGLNTGNVSDAIKYLSPFCVDVSSGVETDGVKDERKISEFVRLARGCIG